MMIDDDGGDRNDDYIIVMMLIVMDYCDNDDEEIDVGDDNQWFMKILIEEIERRGELRQYIIIIINKTINITSLTFFFINSYHHDYLCSIHTN